MKKSLVFLLLIVFNFNCYSQISFEKGYYIDNTDKKIDCLIKNIDWKNNPTEFEYRLSENSESKKATIESVKEFGVENTSKYIRSIVDIDRSSETVNELSNQRNPVFEEQQVFLKVLVEGKANLYLFEEGNLRRYFYNKEDSDIKPLIFKSYITPEGQIGQNDKFRQQLWLDLKCPDFKMSKIENVDYRKNDLIRLFTEYSECYDNKSVDFESKQKRDLFNLTLRPRLNNSSLTIQNSVSDFRNTDFGNKLGFGFGVEAEFLLPFNKNKWAICIEPTYQRFKTEKTSDVNNIAGGKLTAKVDYSSIEIPVSLRHYFFLNNNSKFFLDASVVFDLTSKSSIEFTGDVNAAFNSLEIETRSNLAAGVGYKQNDRYSLEIRYQTNREILTNQVFWSSEYKTFSIIFGYSIF